MSGRGRASRGASAREPETFARWTAGAGRSGERWPGSQKHRVTVPCGVRVACLSKAGPDGARPTPGGDRLKWPARREGRIDVLTNRSAEREASLCNANYPEAYAGLAPGVRPEPGGR